MADLEKTVAIIFNAVDNTGGAIVGMSRNIDTFANNLESVAKPLNALADGVKTIDVAIVGLGLALGGAALLKAGEFGDQINEIATLFNGTPEQIAAFSQEVQNYAATSSKSLADINGALYSAISAGVDYKASVQFVSEAERLSVAGKSDLNASTLVLVSTLNAYGASTSEAAHYSDILFNTVKLGQTTLPELAQSLAQVTGIASSAGIPFDDLSAAIAALTATGLPTSQAITELKSAISNIIKPSGEAEKAAADLGIQFDSSALKSKGLAGVLKDVWDKTRGNTGEMTKFFGSVEGLNAALVLGSDQSGKFAADLLAMSNATGATSAAFKIMAENFGQTTQNMKNQMDLLLVAIGTPLQDEFKDLAGAINGIFQNLKVSVDAGTFAPLYDAISGVEGDLARFLTRLGENLPAALEKVDWGKFTDGIEALSDGIGSMFSGLDLDTPEGLAKTIQMIADAAGNFLAAGGGIAESWGKFIDTAVLPAIQSFADLSTNLAKLSGEMLGWGDIAEKFIGPLKGLGDGLKGLGGALEVLAGVWSAAIFRTMIPSMEALSVAALSKTGVVGLFLLIGEVLGKLVAGEGPMELAAKALYRLASGGDDSADKIARLRAEATAGGEEIKGFADKTAKAADVIGQAGDASDKAGAKTKDWAEQQVYAAAKAEYLKTVASGQKEAIRDAAAILVEAAQGAGKYAEAQKLIGDESAKAGAVVKQAGAAIRTYTGEINGQVVTLKGTADAHAAAKTKVRDFADMVDTASEAAKGNAKDVLALTKTVGDYQVQMRKIEADLQGKAIESHMKLNIADVEANAKIAVALIDSISETYRADIGLIGDLMGQVTAGYNLADRFRITMAESANRRADETHAAQMALIATQMDYLNAKTQTLVAGNPLVTIQADGLQPHLEAFMWEILNAIQVKMALDGGDMLVGGCSL